VGTCSRKSREQHPESLGGVSHTVVGGACPGSPELPQAGARREQVVFVFRCARAEGVVWGVEDTVVMERGSGACSIVSKDPEEHLDLLWCKAILFHL
jgi:hypothetical protein